MSGHNTDHSGHSMDHSGHTTDHSAHMNHSGHTVDHSAHMNHTGHDMGTMDAAKAVLNATLSAVATAASEVATTVQQHLPGTGDSGHDHAAMGHDHAAMGHDQAAIVHDHSQHMAAAGTAAVAGDAAHNMAGHSMSGHGMAMTFHFGVNEFVLFDAWHVTTAGGMVASCLGLFILALLYEGLKYKREDLLRKNATRNQFDTIRVPTDGGVTEVTTVSNPRSAGGPAAAAADPDDQPGSESDVTTEREPITAAGRRRQDRQRMLSKQHFLQTFLHAVQVVVGYFLMLAFMTYNVWLGIAIVLGAAAGYFIFGSKKFVVVDVTEHCH